MKILINNIFYKKSIFTSIDTSKNKFNKISYIGVILYFIKGNENTKWAIDQILISFNSFSENYTAFNISYYYANILNNFNINLNSPIITD